MGRRSGGSNKSKPGNKKQSTEPNSSANTHDDSIEEDLLESLMFKPMPPNKRNELNLIVKKLLNLSSNFVADEPTSAPKLRQELDEIFDLVTKIIALEEQFNMSRKLRSSRKPYLKTLIDWLESHGAKLDGVEPEDYGQNAGFGLRATKDLSKGDLVISIPRRCFMSTETARDSTISTLIEKDPMLKSMPNVALALHLLIEKNSPASFWEPYINVLPNYYSTVLYFSPADFDELKGSPAYEDALRQFKYVARQYAYFYGKFQTTMLRDYFTFEDYRWAVSTVMTRQNQVPCKSDVNKTGFISIEELSAANQSRVVQEKFAKIGLTFEEAKSIFGLLDYEGTGLVELNRFVGSCRELVGGAKRRDIAQVEVTVGAPGTSMESKQSGIKRTSPTDLTSLLQCSVDPDGDILDVLTMMDEGPAEW